MDEFLSSAAINPNLVGPTLPPVPPFTLPTGPTGDTGPGSTLFVTNKQGGTVVIPVDANDLFIMDIQVTTTEDNQRVKLDVTLTLEVDTRQTATLFSYDFLINLIRNPSTTIASTEQRGNYLRLANASRFYFWHPNFTIVDVPGPAGNYTYRVSITQIITPVNTDMIFARNLGLTAVVYPPA